MRPAVGTRDQIRAHMHVLEKLDAAARRLEKIIKSDQTIEDPIEAAYDSGALSVFPFFRFGTEMGHDVLKFDDDIAHPIQLDADKPIESLWEMSQCLRLPGPGETYHFWHEAVAVRIEKALRDAQASTVIEADGLTCWVFALEGMKGKGHTDEMRKAVRSEIETALSERRSPEGDALSFILKGHAQHCDPGSSMVGKTLHWEYEDGHYSAIAKIDVKSIRAYEGIRISSSFRFSSRCSLEGSVLKLRIPAIPEATALSLAGKPIEQAINDPRLHGWNLHVTGLMRNNRQSDGNKEISDIHLDTNRGEEETRLHFVVPKRHHGD